MKKLINLTEQDIHNIVHKAAVKIINENNGGADLIDRYVQSLGDYIDSFEDRNEWDEDIKETYGEDFFYDLDDKLFEAIRNAIMNVAKQYKSRMQNY